MVLKKNKALMNEYNLHIIDLECQRPRKVRALIAQTEYEESDYTTIDHLFFLTDTAHIKQYINTIFTKAKQQAVDVIVFPELSIPQHLINDIAKLNSDTQRVIIAGSHYYKSSNGYISRCPVIIGKHVYFTEKISPSPLEKSPIADKGLTPGEKILLFKNSPIGNFAILICSDYLQDKIKQKLIQYNIDVLFVVAFQRQSDIYHSRMNIDCESNENGIYIIYSNMSFPKHGDGKSSLFGLMDRLYIEKMIQDGYTNEDYSCKIITTEPGSSYLVFDIDIANKVPSIRRTVNTQPNFKLVDKSTRGVSDNDNFCEIIGVNDNRYLNIEKQFVAPQEYDTILSKLRTKRILFLIGDPGIGKTYTAIKILRSYYKNGYRPIFYPGLEASERTKQREALDTFSPKQKQIVYFEDPFGRAKLEERDSLYRTFGPLIDRLAESDSYLLITSRKEIFEKFTRDSLCSTIFNSAIEEMNIVKPSYTSTSLKEILIRLAPETSWFNNKTALDIVLKGIESGALNTPLSIRNFVYTTEYATDSDTLKEQLSHRRNEEKNWFAEEMKNCELFEKLILCLTFILGNQHIHSLRRIYDYMIGTSPNFIHHFPPTFMEAVRSQLGFRLEQTGTKEIRLKFIHQLYEESFVELICNDRSVLAIATTLLKTATQHNPRMTINALLRQINKYQDMVFRLLDTVVCSVDKDSTLIDKAYIGSRLLGASNTVGRYDYFEIIKRLFSIEELVVQINQEHDLSILSYSLRFLYNYAAKRYWKKMKKSNWKYKCFNQINFRRICCLLLNQSNHSIVIDVLFYIWKMDIYYVGYFLSLHNQIEISTLFLCLSYAEKKKLSLMASNSIYKGFLEKLLEKSQSANGVDMTIRSKKQVLTNGGVTIDDGAKKALILGSNLLPIGITRVLGSFGKKDYIQIFDTGDILVGHGVTLYSSDELNAIKGKHSSMIEETLGYSYGNKVLRKAIIQHWF